MSHALDAWLDQAVLEPGDLDAGDAEVLVLGEFNHFVHEKGDFRITMARQARRLGFTTWAEELGWSDGRRLATYFETRDEAVFDHLSLFGWRGEARSDRDDRPTGIFRASWETYPFARMRAEQARFYRTLEPGTFHGFDVAAGHDGGYADLLARLEATGAPAAWAEAIARRPGESLQEEAARLSALLDEAPAGLDLLARADLSALIDGLTYTTLVKDAATYAETAPAMAFREDAMKRRLADLPRKADFGPDTLNARLAARFDRPVLLDARSAPETPVRIAHMYNTVIETSLPGAVDAVWFTPRVSPLQL